MLKISRRGMFGLAGGAALVWFWFSNFGKWFSSSLSKQDLGDDTNRESPLGVSADGKSNVYITHGESPEANLKKLIDAKGGIHTFIGLNDIVVLKPNAQWWNQGMTNTDTMKAFIESVLMIPGFNGEIIIAENHHFPEKNSRGWTTENRNGVFNYNELVGHFIERGHKNVSKFIWHDGAESKPGLHGGAELGGLTDGPKTGDGYKWCSDLIYRSPGGRKVMMSYPVFTSSYSGITIDLMKGAWKDGAYIETPVKLINFSALNHHEQTGVTASVKNYLGIPDLTCGYRGLEPKGFHNFHFIGFSSIHWRIKPILERFGWRNPYEYIGGAVGYFMRNVRFADMNVVTAENVGYGGRLATDKAFHAKAVALSSDPVALDYVCAKDILMPATLKMSDDPRLLQMNNPDNRDGVFYKFLAHTQAQGIGNLSDSKINVIRG